MESVNQNPEMNRKAMIAKIEVTLTCMKPLDDISKQHFVKMMENPLLRIVDDVERLSTYCLNCTSISKEAIIHIRTPLDASTVTESCYAARSLDAWKITDK